MAYRLHLQSQQSLGYTAGVSGVLIGVSESKTSMRSVTCGVVKMANLGFH